MHDLQEFHGVRNTAGDGEDCKESYCAEQHEFSAEDIAEFCVDDQEACTEVQDISSLIWKLSQGASIPVYVNKYDVTSQPLLSKP